MHMCHNGGVQPLNAPQSIIGIQSFMVCMPASHSCPPPPPPPMCSCGNLHGPGCIWVPSYHRLQGPHLCHLGVQQGPQIF